MENKILWKVIDPTPINGKLKCKCICGKERFVNANNLKQGITKSCGCIKTKNLPKLTEYHGYKIGDKINRLTIIGSPIRQLTKNGSNGMANVIYLPCKCDCGKIIQPKAVDVVIRQTIKSCGCTNLGQRMLGKMPRRVYRYQIVQAKTRKVEFNLSFEYLSKLFDKQNNKCALSGVELCFDRKVKTASLDRIDSSKGYIIGNVQWVHVDINYAKLELSQKEFIDMCKRVVEYTK